MAVGSRKSLTQPTRGALISRNWYFTFAAKGLDLKSGSSQSWSQQRRTTAQRISATLYGVVAIMSAELAVKPGAYDYAEVAVGALLVGLAVTATKIFVELVKKETEIGAHLPVGKVGAIVRDSLMVLLFPLAVAVAIMVAALITARWVELLDLILYCGMATVFAIGFLSSYILDDEVRPAATRGVLWLLLSVVLVVAKKLA